MLSELRKQRRDRELTLDKLSQHTGIHLNILSRYERGLQIPTFQHMRVLAQALDVSVSSLFPDYPDISTLLKSESRFQKRVLKKMSEDEKDELLESPIIGDQKETRRIIIQCAKKYNIPVPKTYGLIGYRKSRK